MLIPFSVVVGLLTFVFVIVTGFASLPQLLGHASETTAAIISIFATDAVHNIVAGIENNVTQSTEAVMHIRAGTLRIGNPFEEWEGSGSRAVKTRLWMLELWEQGVRLSVRSGILVRWASDSSMMTTIKGVGAKAQICQARDRYLGAPFNDLGFDRLENCSITVLALPETELLEQSNPLVTEPFVSNFRTGYLGVAWNLTQVNMERLRRASKAARGFWSPAPSFLAENIVVNRYGAVEFVTGFLHQYATMSFDAVTEAPVALIFGRTIFTDFGPTLRTLLPTDNSRAFLVDGLDNVMSYSHGKTFQLHNRSIPADELLVGQKNCHLYTAKEPVFGCFYNISSHPDFEMLHLVINNMTAPIAAVLSASSSTGDDLTNFNHKLMKVPRLVTLANGSKFVAFTKPLQNSFIGFTFQAYIFIPVDYFEQGVNAARTSTIAVVSVVGVFGALLSIAAVWWTTRSVAELAERMDDDPFGMNDHVGAAARQKFLRQKQKMLAGAFGQMSPSALLLSPESSNENNPYSVGNSNNNESSSNAENAELAEMYGGDDDEDEARGSHTDSTNIPANMASRSDPACNNQQQLTSAVPSIEITGAPKEQQQQQQQQWKHQRSASLVKSVSEQEKGKGDAPPPSLLQRIGLFFSQFEEVTALEAEFEAFRAVIDELRGFVRLPPMHVLSSQEGAEVNGRVKTTTGMTTGASMSLSANNNHSARAFDMSDSLNDVDMHHEGDDAKKKKKKRVAIADAVLIDSEDGLSTTVSASTGGKGRGIIDVLQAGGHVNKSTTLFVAVIHVVAFNGAERDAILGSRTTTTASTTVATPLAAAAALPASIDAGASVGPDFESATSDAVSSTASKSARGDDAKFLQFASLVVESLNFLAVSNGATITEFHGDHFLICMQSRAKAITKMPTRFAMRLAHFARLFADYLSREEAASQCGSVENSSNNTTDGKQRVRRRFELSAGLSMSAAKMFVDSTSSQDLQQQQRPVSLRPVSFFGNCFSEAFGIEHALRTYAPAITPAELQQQQQQQLSSSPQRKPGGKGFKMQVTRRNTGSYAYAPELAEGADEFSLLHRVNDDDDTSGSNRKAPRESDTNAIRNALAGARQIETRQQQQQQEQARTDHVAPSAVPALVPDDSSDRPIPHCIGFPTRLQGMFESVRCVSFVAPTFKKTPALTPATSAKDGPADVAGRSRTHKGNPQHTKKRQDDTANGDSGRDLQTMMRIVQVTRVAKSNRVLPIAPL